jgi:hypothetical protein
LRRGANRGKQRAGNRSEKNLTPMQPDH